jgi:hypothetical protein
VDHIIPRAVCPELDNVIANLELMPMRMNSGKSDRVGSRQRDMARNFHKARLLSEKGLKAVEAAGKVTWRVSRCNDTHAEYQGGRVL